MFKLHVKNWKVVALCLLAATTFWFLRAMNKTHVSNIELPLKVYYPDSLFYAEKEIPKFVKLEVHDEGWNLLYYNAGYKIKPLTYQVITQQDVKDFGKEVFIEQIKEQLPEVKFEFLPQKLELKLDTIIDKVVNLKFMKSSFETPQKAIVGQPKLSKTWVSARGPLTALSSIDTLYLGEKHSTTGTYSATKQSFSKNYFIKEMLPASVSVKDTMINIFLNVAVKEKKSIKCDVVLKGPKSNKFKPSTESFVIDLMLPTNKQIPDDIKLIGKTHFSDKAGTEIKLQLSDLSEYLVSPTPTVTLVLENR